jgi:hypothetical protein
MKNIRNILRSMGSWLTNWRRTIETKVAEPPPRPKIVLQVKGIRKRIPWEDKTPEERQRIRDYLKCEERFMMSRRTTLYRPFPY